MAGFNREDWEDLNITKEEIENLSQALKKEEFRKLLAEYAEEITDPKNIKKYQEDITQLEAERGVDCVFVNPEPGFVVKTSVDGKKKAFVNICKNKEICRPSYKVEIKDNARGLNWSIPFCQAPGREDFDKKRNRCMVYDVVFHPNTLNLAEKNEQFKKLVIDTALNAIEDNYKVNLDKKNIKLLKMNFKGFPFATVIRKKSKVQPVLTEEEIEFHKTIKYPFKPPKENNDPIVKNFESKKEMLGKYTVPKYVIKHSSNIDLQEYTYDKNAKINATIPKELVVEVNLPLLNSTNTVILDVMKKSLHLCCEKPAKYKLDIQLPYNVNEVTGSAKFDKERRLLIITLPVIRPKIPIKDLLKDDSGVESDMSPVGSIEEKNISSLEDSYILIKKDDDVANEEFNLKSEESKIQKINQNDDVNDSFLESDKHYLLPSFSCTLDDDIICFVLKVKNVDSDSVVTKMLNSSSCHIKFFSIGSGFFPVYYSFLIDFKNECNIKSVLCDTWDNNVTVSVELFKNDYTIMKYFVGLDSSSLVEKTFNYPVELKKFIEEFKAESKENNQMQSDINVESANQDEVVISVIPEEAENTDVEENEINDDLYEASAFDKNVTVKEKCRTFSESGLDEVASSPGVRKSILKKRIYRSLSESNADDLFYSNSTDKIVTEGSDLCVHDEYNEVPGIKKTVRFNEKIRQQLFRVNSSILGRKKKNKKKSRNKKKAVEQRPDKDKNFELKNKEKIKEEKKLNKLNQKSLIEVMSEKEEKENCNIPKSLVEKKNGTSLDNEKPKFHLRKDDKIFEFKSDLIFDLDF